MINFYPYFLRDNGNATIKDVVKHINFIRSEIGVDHIGIGADFCGIEE